MGLFNPGSGTSSDPRARAQRLDMLLGIVGVFVFFAFIQVVVLEFRGATPIFEALVLLLFVLAFGYLWRKRKHVFDPKD